MIKYWQPYGARFDQLQRRERVLVLGVVLVLLYAFWSLLFGQPLAKRQALLTSQLVQAEKAWASKQQQLQQLQSHSQLDPDAAMRAQLTQVKQDIAQLDQQLQQAAVGLVRAQELPHILEQVLLKTGKLKLISLQTLALEELTLVASPEPGLESVPDAGVFKHPVRLEVTGDYFAVREYLTALEQLPWRFYWDSLEYEVERYPRARAILTVYTLSSERGVIGG